MSTITRPIAEVRAAVMQRFPAAVDGGVHNCRKIAGSSNWSQHAWGNAWDIFGPGRSASPSDQRFLDEVYAYLIRNRGRLNIGTVCWKAQGGCSAAAHQDHIHVEGPKMRGTPPCAGGSASDTTVDDGAGGGRELTPLEKLWYGVRGGAQALQNPDVRDVVTDEIGGVPVTILRAAAFLTDPTSWVRIGTGALGVVVAGVGFALLSRDLFQQATGVDVLDTAAAVVTKGASTALK